MVVVNLLNMNLVNLIKGASLIFSLVENHTRVTDQFIYKWKKLKFLYLLILIKFVILTFLVLNNIG